jgi:NADPH-dependent glutamate synthase beta subunit-like oxidoreductase
LFWHLPTLTKVRKADVRDKKVAIIGAGPAGLACAHDLALIGYQVTIFEASSVLGGMMRHGIPEFRLSRSIIEKEINKILWLGVEVRTLTPLTKNFGIKRTS